MSSEGVRDINMGESAAGPEPFPACNFLLLARPGLNPDFHFSFGSANHRVDSDAFIYAGLKALKALRRSTPNG